MARQARKGREVIWGVVAILTGVPCVLVGSTVDWEERIMVKRCAIPRVGAMAVQTGGREARAVVLVCVVLGVAGDAFVVIGRLEDQIKAWHSVAVLTR